MDSKQRVVRVIIVLCLIFIWYILTLNQTEREMLFFPSPTAVWNTLINQFNEIISFSFTTWYRVSLGLLIGGLLGFVFGLLMSSSNIINLIFDPIIEIIRPIPPVALTPFFILWFGLGNLSQLLLISMGCFMIICISTYEAIRNVNPIYIRAARSLGVKGVAIYKTIIVPAIMPALLPNIRVALASAFALAVAAEYLGAQGGLGYLIRNARTILQTETILLAALLLGIESMITDWGIRLIFDYINRWMPNNK